jgi:FKBP-type peptidyl-prolyl cis-trans isomerase SlyD
MQIQHHRVATFHYRLTDSEGVAISDSYGAEPITYLHGGGSLVPGLAAGLAGHRAGERLSFSVPPERAYGLHRDLAPERVPIKRLLLHAKPQVGALVTFRHDTGTRQGVVVKVGRYMIDIDPNHPLAGRTLQFEIEILDVREATPEEREHGHAHPPGSTAC